MNLIIDLENVDKNINVNVAKLNTNIDVADLGTMA